MNILQIGSLFLAELGFGSALLIAFYPLRSVGKSFHQFYFQFIFITLALYLASLYRLDLYSHNMLFLLVLPVWIYFLSRRPEFLMIETLLIRFFSAFAFGFMLLFLSQFKIMHHHLVVSVSLYAGFISGAVFLAFHIMNMVFGHWYLVNLDLPHKYLVTMSKALLVASYARVGTVLYAVWLVYHSKTEAEFMRLTNFNGHGIFFWARILAGLGIPLLVAHLALASAKIKSTQSATGILYAGCVFVLMGEIMALYLLSLTGILF